MPILFAAFYYGELKYYQFTNKREKESNISFGMSIC